MHPAIYGIAEDLANYNPTRKYLPNTTVKIPILLLRWAQKDINSHLNFRTDEASSWPWRRTTSGCCFLLQVNYTNLYVREMGISMLTASRCRSRMLDRWCMRRMRNRGDGCAKVLVEYGFTNVKVVEGGFLRRELLSFLQYSSVFFSILQFSSVFFSFL